MKIIRIRHLILTLVLAGLVFGLHGCGGGGDGGTSGPTYTGKTTQATLTTANQDELALNALDAGESGDSLGNIGFSETTQGSGNVQRNGMLLMLAENVKDTLLDSANANQGFSGNGAVPTLTQTNPGTCPGHPGSMVVNTNTSSTTFNGSITYNNFCVGNLSAGSELTMNGLITFSGTFTQSGQSTIFTSMKMSFQNVRMTLQTSAQNTHTESFTGSLALTFDGTGSVTGIHYSALFSSGGKVYKVENMSVSATSTLTIRGRFYHPDYGYVDIKTTESFDLVSGSNPPEYCSGSLQITGDGGVADFTANADCSQYEICFTPTGGAKDCGPGFKNWP